MMSRGRPKRAVKTTQPSANSFQPVTPAATPSGSWAASKILTSKSAAAHKPIESFLSLLLIATTGWDDKYDDAERKAIIDALPPKFRKYEVNPAHGHLLCPIDASMVLDSRAIKLAIAKTKDEILNGYHEVTWLNQAEKATQQRRDGVFDGYLRQHAEDLFGDISDDQAPEDASSNDGNNPPTSDGEWSAQGPIKKPKLRENRPQPQTTKAAGADVADVAMEDVSVATTE